ncbi:MAG: P63C domain-containing protein [Acidobacteria bacterium]|nr:P63C domain-containing protein [Acidobacteriota bacterium]
MSREVALPPVKIEAEELARRLVSPPKVLAHRPDHPLRIGDIEIPCYVLDTEMRVLSARAVASTVRGSRGGNPVRGDEMPEFVGQKWLEPFIHADLLVAMKSPIPFANPEAPGIVYGYPATVLAELCLAIMEADRNGATTSRQQGIVERTSVLLGGFATVGIVALVDEATGYEKIRAERSLARILDQWLAKDLQPWVKTFPFEFYELLYGLNGWELPPPPNGKMPGVVGTLTVDLVYARLAPGVLREVMNRADELPKGSRWHQWFTPEHGHPRVQEQIRMAIAFMKTATRWSEFKNRYNVACPAFHDDAGQLKLELEHEVKKQRELRLN